MTAQLASGGVAVAEAGDSGHRQLTVYEMQLALAAARNQAADATQARPPATPSAAPEAGRTPATDLVTASDRWLPDRDGPVSLAGAALPRTRQRGQPTMA